MEELSLNDMLDVLKQGLEKKAAITPSVETFFNAAEQFVIFLSITDGASRAHVVVGKGATFEAGWKQATQNLRKMVLQKRLKALWVKADFVTAVETVQVNVLLHDLAHTPTNHLRRGIAFDKLFHNAFLEQEVNANVFFNQWENEHVELTVVNINTYIQRYRKSAFRVDPTRLREVHLFETVSVFHDGKQLHEQLTGLVSNGAREFNPADKDTTLQVARGAGAFLANCVDKDGRFTYINYPAFNRSNQEYNMLQHATTIHAMLDVHELQPDDTVLEAIRRAMDYMLAEAVVERDVNGETCAFIIEPSADNEVKLGANAFAVLALATYTRVTQDVTHLLVLEKLAAGIRQFQDDDGAFVHVLHEDGTVKDKFRTRYYEGEAVFALMHLYGLQQNEQHLATVEKAFSVFMEKNYWKHGDPWLTQAASMLFLQQPKIEYAEFNLQTMKRQLTNAFGYGTDAVTLTESLVDGYQLLRILNAHQIKTNVLTDMDVEKLKRAIVYRIRQQFNSYLWPEMAMYFELPDKIVGSFYMRHDAYRIRMDEVANHISGLVAYYYLLSDWDVAAEPFMLESLGCDAEAEVLTLAKRYKDKKRYDDMLALFVNFVKNDVTYMDITYATYAEALRVTGQTNRAKEILGAGNALYPASEAILVEFLNVCMNMNDYQSALVVAGDLIKLDPKEGKYYLELGRAFSQIGENAKAEAAYKIGLIYHHEMATEQLIEKVQETITDNATHIHSTYRYLGGMNNLGVIQHEQEAKAYITKITRLEKGSLRENLFYEKVLKYYPRLADVVPAHSHTEIMDDLQYMTIEKVDNVKKNVSVEEIVRVSEQITSVAYDDIVKPFPNPRYDFVLQKNMGPPAIEFFTEIHRREQNESLFVALNTYLKQQGFFEKMAPLLMKLESLVMGNELYTHLDPAKHYSLLHGDFTLANMSVRESDGALQVLDWGSFTIGPRFMDMALMLSNLPISIEGMKNTYLLSGEVERPLAVIERIYFLFGFITLYCVKLTEGNAVHLIERSITPALEYMSECVDEL